MTRKIGVYSLTLRLYNSDIETSSGKNWQMIEINVVVSLHDIYDI